MNKCSFKFTLYKIFPDMFNLKNRINSYIILIKYKKEENYGFSD